MRLRYLVPKVWRSANPLFGYPINYVMHPVLTIRSVFRKIHKDIIVFVKKGMK
jgi:hypothetical protein